MKTIFDLSQDLLEHSQRISEHSESLQESCQILKGFSLNFERATKGGGECVEFFENNLEGRLSEVSEGLRVLTGSLEPLRNILSAIDRIERG